jgi:hypothetical protein
MEDFTMLKPIDPATHRAAPGQTGEPSVDEPGTPISEYVLGMSKARPVAQTDRAAEDLVTTTTHD